MKPVRIYHKKNFWAGLGMAALGILNLALSLWRRDFGLSTGILVGALLLLGGQLPAAQPVSQILTGRQDRGAG